MSRVQYYAAASLDGYIAEEDGGLQWLFDAADDPAEGEDANYNAFYAAGAALAIGATPTRSCSATTRGTTPGARPGSSPTATCRRPTAPTSASSQGSRADHIDAMRAAAGDGILWVLGGGELASQFAEAGLLDELIVTYVPVVLGTGHRRCSPARSRVS